MKCTTRTFHGTVPDTKTLHRASCAVIVVNIVCGERDWTSIDIIMDWSKICSRRVDNKFLFCRESTVFINLTIFRNILKSQFATRTQLGTRTLTTSLSYVGIRCSGDTRIMNIWGELMQKNSKSANYRKTPLEVQDGCARPENFKS